MAEHTCHNCIYSFCDAGLWLRRLWAGKPILASCANHPQWPGQMREVPGVPCRNYRPKPALPGGDDVRLIPLGDGFYAYVDAADYEWLSQWTWHRYGGGYVGRHEKGKTVLMHRQIMQPPKGLLVDHIDGNRSNNCQCNLRICTRQENQRNKHKQFGSRSRFKGVCYDPRKKKWYAKCRIGGKRPRLGSFDQEVEAARAYDLAAVRWYGEFAKPNFPEEWPPERRARVHAEWQEAVKREGWGPAIKGRGPRTTTGKQGEQGSGRKTGNKSLRAKSGNKRRHAETRGRSRPKQPAKTRRSESKRVRSTEGKRGAPSAKTRHAGKGRRKTKVASP